MGGQYRISVFQLAELAAAVIQGPQGSYYRKNIQSKLSGLILLVAVAALQIGIINIA